MEKGMREVPASVVTKERWLKIAEGVEGKTAKECFTRFKELCAKAKAQKWLKNLIYCIYIVLIIKINFENNNYLVWIIF